MHRTPATAQFLQPTKRYRFDIMNIATEFTDGIPTGIQPISATSHTTFAFNLNHTFPIHPTKIIRTQKKYLHTPPHYEQIMFKSTIILKPTLFQQNLEQQEDLIICSDGALKGHKSGGVFVITTTMEDTLVTNTNPDTGHNYLQSSYRSEAQACYSTFLFIFSYCKFHNAQAPSMIYYYDNKGLITRLNNPHTQITTMKECELIQLI